MENILATRRNFLIAGTTATVGAGLGIAGLVSIARKDSKPSIKSDSQLEQELLADFLDGNQETHLDKPEIENLLYNVVTKSKIEGKVQAFSEGSAVALGDGYYLTVYHVSGSNNNYGEKYLLRQSKINSRPDLAQEFSVLWYNKDDDLALLRTQSVRTGKAAMRLSTQMPKEGVEVSVFDVSNVPAKKDYKRELVGKDFHDSSKDIDLGRLVMLDGTRLFETQGRVVNYPEIQNESVSSLQTANGYSGSPIYLRLLDGKYMFAGILRGGIDVPFYVDVGQIPPGVFSDSPPKWHQTGTVFKNRDTIKRFIESYKNRVIKPNY